MKSRSIKSGFFSFLNVLDMKSNTPKRKEYMNPEQNSFKNLSPFIRLSLFPHLKLIKWLGDAGWHCASP
jgi:hypothetical protein